MATVGQGMPMPGAPSPMARPPTPIPGGQAQPGVGIRAGITPQSYAAGLARMA